LSESIVAGRGVDSAIRGIFVDPGRSGSMNRIRSHLSYANVMATIAVFLALGGSGYAALSGKDKKKVKSIADQEIAAQAGGLSVAKAANADTAANAVNANNAVNSANAANADQLDNLDSLDIGIGFLSGRVDNLALTGSTGNPPSGVSAAATTAVVADQDLTLSPDRAIVIRNFRVSLTQAMGCSGTCGGGEVGVARFIAVTPNTSTIFMNLSCSIVPGNFGCTAAGPSAIVPAASWVGVLFTRAGDAQYAAGTDALFSWQATAN
jgi:hypothetical protein